MWFIGCLFLGCHPFHENKKTTSTPNIIYVLADDLGYGDVNVFNENGKIKTPHLDKMAAEGMIFTDAHTSSSVCTPTRYGILTGRYNWRSKLKKSVLFGYDNALINKNRTNVASMLSEHGYHTAFIGKWHLGWNWSKDENGVVDFTLPITNSPNDLGFDYAYGHVASLDIPPYVYIENEIATSIPKANDTTENTGKYSWWRKGVTAPDFNHQDVTPNFFNRGIQYIKDRTKMEQPFFLYLPLPSPHTPILPSKQWQDKSGLNPYADFVLMIDHHMGLLLKTLRETNIDENTLVIFTSDNGCSPAAFMDELVDKGHYPSYIYRGHKADIYEGGHRIPFIVRWPNIIEGGSVNNQTICTTDFMATAASLIGYQLKDNEGEDSYNMLPLLKGEPLDGPFREATVHHSIDGDFAIRKGDWKLIMTSGSGGWSFPTTKQIKSIDSLKNLPPIQLYNLKTDPSEEINLQKEKPEKVAELQSLLSRYILDGRSTPGVAQSNDGEKEIWDQLWWMTQP